MTRAEAQSELARLLADIHPSVLAASHTELIDAGWGDVPRAKIPADWRQRPLPEQHKGGRRTLYRTPEERADAERGWKRKYALKLRTMTVEELRAHNAKKQRNRRRRRGQFPGRVETPELRAEILRKARDVKKENRARIALSA